MKAVSRNSRNSQRQLRPNSLAGIHQDACCRVRGGLRPNEDQRATATATEPLLLQAERVVRHKVWVRKTLPLHVMMLLPGLLFVGTRSKIVLAVFVLTYPLMLVVRALMARILSVWLGSEESLLRIEYQRLTEQAKADLNHQHGEGTSLHHSM